MKWSPQQAAALRDVSAWLKAPNGPQVFYLAGFAGTGKTTLAKHLAAGVTGLVLFSAYTGKAASVLRKMGCAGAATLHSLLYSVGEQDKTTLHELELELAHRRDEGHQDDDALMELEVEIAQLQKKLREPKFTLQEDSVVASSALVVLDECSMVNQPLASDLESFKKKILVMGDPAQLPPVKGGGYYTNRTPDVMLTEIHRQAAENPIIRWATTVRNGGELPFADDGHARKLKKRSIDHRDVMLAPGVQLLAGKNDTRRNLNQYVRKHLDRDDCPYPVKGDRLVVLRNDRDWGVLNGVTCEAAEDAAAPEGEEHLSMDVAYEGLVIQDMPVDRAYFDAYADPAAADPSDGSWDRRWMVPMDYGYCLTVHKAQGSQWDHVVLCDDGFAHWHPRMRSRWLYTAITRASERLTILA